MTRRGAIALLVLTGLLALPSAAQACRGRNNGKAAADARERAMLCLAGIGLQTGKLEGDGGARVWTEEFGSRSC